MLALTCMSERSAAMTNSVGAEKLAATVCPTSTLRAMTTPSIGEVMTVFSRLTCGTATAERACSILASAPTTCGGRGLARGLGESAGPPPAAAASPRARARAPARSSAAVCATRSRSASASAAHQRGPRLLERADDRSTGRASPATWPLRDDELKSGGSDSIDARDLAADLHRGDRLERAGGEIAVTMSPRVAASVVSASAVSPRRE